jgi:alpha-1,3-glucosyltransferase
MTVLAMLPASLDLLRFPTKRRFIYALFNVSLAFFLFSFQVHEKSILLVTLPAAMLVLEQTVFATWFIGLANFRCRAGGPSARG